MPNPRWQLSLVIGAAVLLAGCPKGHSEFDEGARAEEVQDYDTALVHYQRALRSDPANTEYKLRALRAQFEAAQAHVEQGQRALENGDFNLALAEFRRAQSIDPSSPAADQGAQRTLDRIATAAPPTAPKAKNRTEPNLEELESGPPQLKPFAPAPINLQMTNDARILFETIAKLAGLSVIFDPDFVSRRISLALPGVTLEQALDAVCAEAKAFWIPMTTSVILVAPDNPQKRRELEEEVVGTFYLSNVDTPQDLTEVVGALRQLLDLRRVQQDNADDAIVIRDTPAKLELADQIIHDIDKAKPEVLLQVSVLQTSLSRLRDLGILPGQSTTLTFTPRSALTPSSSSSDCGTSSASGSCIELNLNNLRRLSSADYSITLPGAAVNAVMTDSATRVIQNPEIRVTDGQQATLKVGDRVPVATGSFQAGVGSSATGVSPLVNTQFQYIDVGVNLVVTPRVHPDGEIGLKLKVEVSSVTGTQSIGGIEEPIISQRTVEHDVRLKDGEVSILGGLWQRTETNSVNGWPGLARLPFFRYFFSDNKKQVQDDEVLIVLTPHIVRFPGITQEDRRWTASGTDANVRIYRKADSQSDSDAGRSPFAAALSTPNSQPAAATAELRFNPTALQMKTGETAAIALTVSNVHDLFSIPLLLEYDPAVIQVEDVRNGGFLSGGTEEIAIVQRIDQKKGQALISAIRQPKSAGVSGGGTLFGIVIRALAPGASAIRIVDVGARDSGQKPMALQSQPASVQVR